MPGIVEETPSKVAIERERRYSSPGVSDAGEFAASFVHCMLDVYNLLVKKLFAVIELMSVLVQD